MSWYLTRKCPHPHNINLDYHWAINVEIPHGENKAHLCSEWEPAGFFLLGGLPGSGPTPQRLLQQRRSCLSHIKVENKSFFLPCLSVSSFNLIERALGFGIGILLKITYWVLSLLQARLYSRCWVYSSGPKRANPQKTKSLSSKNLHCSGDTPRCKKTWPSHTWKRVLHHL